MKKHQLLLLLLIFSVALTFLHTFANNVSQDMVEWYSSQSISCKKELLSGLQTLDSLTKLHNEEYITLKQVKQFHKELFERVNESGNCPRKLIKYFLNEDVDSEKITDSRHMLDELLDIILRKWTSLRDRDTNDSRMKDSSIPKDGKSSNRGNVGSDDIPPEDDDNKNIFTISNIMTSFSVVVSILGSAIFFSKNLRHMQQKNLELCNYGFVIFLFVNSLIFRSSIGSILGLASCWGITESIWLYLYLHEKESCSTSENVVKLVIFVSLPSLASWVLITIIFKSQLIGMWAFSLYLFLLNFILATPPSVIASLKSGFSAKQEESVPEGDKKVLRLTPSFWVVNATCVISLAIYLLFNYMIPNSWQIKHWLIIPFESGATLSCTITFFGALLFYSAKMFTKNDKEYLQRNIICVISAILLTIIGNNTQVGIVQMAGGSVICIWILWKYLEIGIAAKIDKTLLVVGFSVILFVISIFVKLFPNFFYLK